MRISDWSSDVCSSDLSWACCRCSTASTARPSSWSPTTPRPPSTRATRCTWTRARWWNRRRTHDMTPPPAKAGGGREGVPTARTDPKGTPPQPSPAFAGEGARGEIDEVPAPDLVRTVPAQDPDHPDPAVDPGRVPAVRPAQRRAHQLRRGRSKRERRRTPADRLAAVVHPDPADLAAAAHPPGRRRSEEHTSELQSLMRISYAAFCLKK